MRLLLIIAFLITINSLDAQTKLSGRIKGVTKIDTVQINILFDGWYYEPKNIILVTESDGSFSTILPIEKSQSIFFIYKGKKVLVYTEPKRSLVITFAKDDIEHTIQFEGSLKPENNFRKETGLSFFELNSKLRDDSLNSPSYIIKSVRQRQSAVLTKLVGVKTSTSPAFQRITQKDIEYFLAAKLWEIIWDKGVFSAGKKTVPDVQPWRTALQEAYDAYPVSDNDAVDSYFYHVMVAYYPRALELTAPGIEAFQNLAEKLLQKPGEEALKELREQGRRMYEYKAFSYGFKGLALEFALASFISNSINGGELGYVKEGFNDFVSRFPKSRYLTYVNKMIAPYLSSLSSNSVGNMVFDEANLADTSLENILAKHKGKIVYIDLWGTWCGPCREEFQYNKALKAHFKNKPVDFVYIAFEHTTHPEKLWKETVKFYNLAGRHILAGKQLRTSVERMYSSDGSLRFPSYLLVDEHGTINTLSAKRPSAKAALYKQIDQLLKQ
jgi:thiol-disulfide isomerase/thioredoxin